MNDNNRTNYIEDLDIFSEKVSNNYKNFITQRGDKKTAYVQTSVFCGYPGIGKTTFFQENFRVDSFSANNTTKVYIDCFKIQDNFNQKIVNEMVCNDNYHLNQKRNNLKIFRWFFNLSAKWQEVFVIFLNLLLLPVIGLLSGSLLLSISKENKAYMWVIFGLSLFFIMLETVILCIGMHYKNLLAIKSKFLLNKKVKNLIIIFDEIDRVSDNNKIKDILVNIALIREHLASLNWFESINFIISTNKSVAVNVEDKPEDNLFFYNDKKICDVVYKVRKIELDEARKIFEQYLQLPDEHIILSLIRSEDFSNSINTIFKTFNRRIFRKMIDTIHGLLSIDDKFIEKLFKDSNEYHLALFSYAMKKYYDGNFDFNADEVFNLKFTENSTLETLNYAIFKFIDDSDFTLKDKLEETLNILKDIEEKLENLMNESNYWDFWKEILYDQSLVEYFESKGFIYLLKNLINKYESKFNYELKNNDVIYDWTQIRSKEFVNICNLINSKIIEKNFNKSVLSLMTDSVDDEWLPWEEKKLIYKLYLFNVKSLGSLVFTNKDNSFFPLVGHERDKAISLNYPFEFISISDKWNDSLFKVSESNLIKHQWNEEKWYLRFYNTHDVNDVINWNSKFAKAYQEYITNFEIEAAIKEVFNIFGIVNIENNEPSFYRNELRENYILISLINFLDYVRNYRIKEEFDKLLDLGTIRKDIASNKDLVLHLNDGLDLFN